MHYLVGVIVPKGTKTCEAGSEAESLLEPFSDSLEVEPYEAECCCKEWRARDKATKNAEQLLGRTLKDLNLLFQNIPPEIRPTWEEWVTPYTVLSDKLYEKYLKVGEPDPECEECQGKGTYQSTANPDGQYDWYQIGGRWTGVFGNYDPEKDPANLETCQICGGTGLRNDNLGQQARAEDPNYTCNGCQGKGKSLKWPTAWKQKGNITTTDKLLAKLEAKNTPFAIITPEGDWVDSDKEDKVWEEHVRQILKSYPHQKIVAVDFHV